MKNNKLEIILELISEYEVTDQKTLQTLLTERGFDVTQATVSRDIKRLNIVKVRDGNGIIRYMKPTPKNVDSGIFSGAIIKADYAMNTAVLKCRTGMAQAVCTSFDAMEYPGVVGTIAGDDTIFILMRTELDAKELCRRFRKECCSD